MIGVSLDNTTFQKAHQTENAYLFYSYTQSIEHNKTSIKGNYGKIFSQGEIEMQVNTKKGSVSYVIEGENYGIAFTDQRF